MKFKTRRCLRKPHCRNIVASASRARRKAGCSKRSGATLVEFALVSNVFLVTLFTCIEFARMNMARNMAQDAAYYAARVAIVPGATEQEAFAEADRIMGSLFPGGYTIDVAPLGPDAEEVSVTVAVNMDDIAFFVPIALSGVTLESTATMQTERYAGFFEQ